MLKNADNPPDINDEEMRTTEEFKEFQSQMKAIQPIRHGIIKKFFEKYKYVKKKRDMILKFA